ncbi:SRPBCC family protein [Streptomyces sp. NPDC087917]|uniref:SRPBCC family protein n=1 Tax=unclassified Streptomyces TaxID=2593676 RepID=UPI00342585AC
MTEYERSRTMPALPEHVFDQAAQVEQMDQWLPEEIRVHDDGLPAVTVREGGDEAETAALLRARPEQMRLEWGTRQDGAYAGWLQVAGLDGGPSAVTVHLSFFAEDHDPGEQAVNALLDRSLERLEDQVRLRVDGTAG